MVKKWIIIMSILAVLTLGCVIEYRYVNGSFEYLSKNLMEFKPMLEQNEDSIDSDENIEYINTLHENWHKRVEILKGLIWHTGLKDVEVGLSRIMTYTKENDFTEAMTELDALIDYVYHYASDFKLNASNLF